jgi:cytochrome P450
MRSASLWGGAFVSRGAFVTTTSSEPIEFDPYAPEMRAAPWDTYRRMRDEAPLFYNAEHDCYAVSRYVDVEATFKDWETFSSRRGDILEFIKAGIDYPPGLVIWEDPPTHTMHRSLMARMFTPKKVAALEPKMREFCATVLDPLQGTDRFDFVTQLGHELPMRVIGMLLGIPEEDQAMVRDETIASLRTEEGKPMKAETHKVIREGNFGEYLDWRVDHPSDDIMTELLNAEFDDEHGVRRRLSREELLTYVTVVAAAGNETTSRLIGWMGKVFGEHPDQRRLVTENRALLANAVDEVLRFEPTGLHTARYVTKDVEFHGQTVPAGSAILLLMGSANRDERRYTNPAEFNVLRNEGQHISFGFGTHFCLGASLARMEGRIALDEVLNRFPDWEVDHDNMVPAHTSTVRGWDSMPTFIR